MQVITSAIINGEFADKYGKRGSQFNENGMSTFSIPFEISSAPERVHSLLPWCWKTTFYTFLSCFANRLRCSKYHTKAVAALASEMINAAQKP